MTWNPMDKLSAINIPHDGRVDSPLTGCVDTAPHVASVKPNVTMTPRVATRAMVRALRPTTIGQATTANIVAISAIMGENTQRCSPTGIPDQALVCPSRVMDGSNMPTRTPCRSRGPFAPTWRPACRW